MLCYVVMLLSTISHAAHAVSRSPAGFQIEVFKFMFTFEKALELAILRFW